LNLCNYFYGCYYLSSLNQASVLSMDSDVRDSNVRDGFIGTQLTTNIEIVAIKICSCADM